MSAQGQIPVPVNSLCLEWNPMATHGRQIEEQLWEGEVTGSLQVSSSCRGIWGTRQSDRAERGGQLGSGDGDRAARRDTTSVSRGLGRRLCGVKVLGALGFSGEDSSSYRFF